MELNEIVLSKTLHYMVEQFISSIKSYFEPEVLELRKIFCEIIKRSELIIQDLRSIATYANSTLETSDILDVKDQLDKRVQELVQNLLQQDFVDLILSADDDHVNITESELHNFLHSGAMTDVTNLSPFALNLGLPFNFHSPLFESVELTDLHRGDRNLNCFLSSSQFENSRVQFEDEVNELRRIMENGFSASDLNLFNVASILKYENTDVVEKISTASGHKRDSLEPENIIHPVTFPPDFDIGIFNDADSKDSDAFLSWEGCLGNFLPDHLFISEVTPEVALLNISEKESQTYYSLLNPSDAISEEDMVHDVLDLLTGIASDTFYYDIHARKFRMKSGVHLPNLSPECTAKIVSKFIESGSIYYLLHKFSYNFFHSGEGLMFKGLQLGVQQVLSMYKEYIAGVQMNSPSMLSLRMDVAQNAEMLQTFGAICGIDSEKMIFNEIPKGLGVLSYLHNVAQSHRRKENEIMIAVLLKYTYAPYFNFLNKWLTEGICDDLYGEFQIMEDFNYLGRRDSMYWKFAYTENIDDPTRAVPPEIKSYSQGILDCGKSINLLKICSPNLFCLKFLYCKPPPPLSMVFSLPAVISKLRESLEYIALKKTAEEVYSIESDEVSVDRSFTECQKFVTKEVMMDAVQRRWDILCAAAHANSNILCSSQMTQYFKDRKSSKCMCGNIKISNKWKSLCSLNFDQTNKEHHFSGKLYGNIGLLFSSCGYYETDLKSGAEEIQISFMSPDFSRQLDLISYTQVFADNLTSLTRHEKLLSGPEVEFLNAVQVDPFSKCDSERARNIEKKHSTKENSSCKLSYNQVSCESTEEKELNAAVGRSEEKNKCARSFIEKLASLLISEYSDSIEDVYTCIQVTSLQRLMMHNFNAVLKMRIHLVEGMIMKYIVKQLGLDSLLCNLRNLYFLQDETFSQSICEQLFSLVMKCKTPRAFANWAVLSEILQTAVSDCNQENNFLSSVNVNVTSVPDEMPAERTEFLRLFRIEYEVKWPLNIIVHQMCMQQYLRIFSTLLEIEFLCWLLSRIWRILIVTSKEIHLDDAPQFRDIMLKRFDMEQFIRIIRNSIHQHLQGPLWECLQKSLSVEESSIDRLENIHYQYLEKALARCFLTDETHVLHELMSVMLRQIYKFSSTVFHCTWRKNHKTGNYETFEYNRLLSYFDTFKQYQKVFLKRITKETLTKKFGRHWDKDYQDFLDTILETEKNIA